jgi:hypothetical protein
VFTCRNAGFFLLQRLKGNMPGDARDFNNIETRSIINLFSARQGAEGISRHSDRNIRGILTVECHRPQFGVPV